MYVDTSTAHDPASGPGIVEIVPGNGVTVDNSDPSRPTISAEGGGGGVQTVEAGPNIVIDATDAAHPIVLFDSAADFNVVAPSSFSGFVGDPETFYSGVSVSDARAQIFAIGEDGAASVTVNPDRISLAGPKLVTPSGAFTVGADDTDLVIDGSSYYFKLAGVGVLVINSGGLSIQSGAVFNPGHVATVSLPDPTEHTGGILWDTTALKLAVSDGTSWQHITAA